MDEFDKLQNNESEETQLPTDNGMDGNTENNAASKTESTAKTETEINSADDGAYDTVDESNETENEERENADNDGQQDIPQGEYNYSDNDFTIGTDKREGTSAANKKGLRVFAVVMAIVLLLSSAMATGYFVGKNSNNSSQGNKKDVSVDLEPKPTDRGEYSESQVYASVNKSVVGIYVCTDDAIKGSASGVVYSEDGYIVTNDHIYANVENAKFKVCTYDGTVYDAVYVAGDTRSDLAVIKINDSGFSSAVFGDSNELVYGEKVVAIGRGGSDASANSTITSGIVSYINRRVSGKTSYSSKLIQTDAAINPGSSGGALVNMYGQVVGITSSKLTGSSYEGIGFAIPSSTVKKVVESLITNGNVTNRAKLGISYYENNSVSAELNKVPNGLYVASVSEDSDAFGKINEGDTITAADGQRAYNDDVVLDIIEDKLPGDKITLEIVTSGGEVKTVEVTLLQDIGTSSYNSKTESQESQPLNPDESQDGSGSSSFDFPYGY